MPRLRLAAAVLAVVALGSALSGCASTVSLEPADDANNPLCAQITVNLPGQLAGQTRHWTNAQATGAWGEPTSIILSCGVTPPGPTELECDTFNGVDWVIDDSKAPNYWVTTFGRDPAVQVFLNSEVVPPRDVLDSLGPIVSAIPADGECTSR